ncbi:MAG: hypothetical protein AABX00_05355 [Nanoarchaeota archaeon]
MHGLEVKKNDLDAIVARMNGLPYSQVIEEFEINPQRFLYAVTKKLPDLVELAVSSGFSYFFIAKQIHGFKDDDITRLLEMEEEFLRQQYRRLQNGKSKKFPDGAFMHTSISSNGLVPHDNNIETIVYIALTENHPRLASQDRNEVVDELSKLASEHRYVKRRGQKETTFFLYFNEIGLGGIMNKPFVSSSPLVMLKYFDSKFQKVTGNASVFDLNQPTHLHEWGDPFVTPNGYFSSSTTVDEAVYHTLTRHTSDKLQKLLGSSRRKNVLKGIELMSPSIVFFQSLGFGGLIGAYYKNGGTEIAKIFLESLDRAFRSRYRGQSLMNSLVFNSKGELVKVDY